MGIIAPKGCAMKSKAKIPIDINSFIEGGFENEYKKDRQSIKSTCAPSFNRLIYKNCAQGKREIVARQKGGLTCSARAPGGRYLLYIKSF